ncbi:hypothetical protein K469DRAFT_716268 [Zopfia rhizophila CBS 207.26]|uniref:MARVEL domain-containing protein n=1 Tax=Zopfia rhizophila CBS 207.26 TaxID=1314779 RepID=A0A6A6DKJ7_9PEZI|nr:hypothetical protein K469DRAFT_716268 [Zopfia rhizophila CBS 207.26]
MVSASLSAASSRTLLSISHFMAWASSAIVTGITSYFLNNFRHGQHLIFEEVIAVLTLAFWLPSFALPFYGTYKNVYFPLNFIFSYLWLTSFIFAAQDYNWKSCDAMSPAGGRCTLKLTNEAFIFLAFFFILVATIVETLAWKARTETVSVNEPGKEATRPSVETA